MSDITFDILNGIKLKDVPAYKEKLQNINTSEIDPEVRYSQEILSEYQSAKKTFDDKAILMRDFRLGFQWTQADYDELKARNQAPIVENIIHEVVEQAKSMLTTNKPRFSATGREFGDIGTANAISDLMAYIWEISKGNAELKQAIEDYYVTGAGWLLAYYDQNADWGKGEVKIKSIDPLDVFPDPASREIDCSDSSHILISNQITIEQAQKMFPGYDFSGVATSSYSPKGNNTIDMIGNSSAISDSQERLDLIDRYSKIKQQYFYIFEKNTYDEVIKLEEEMQEWLEGPVIAVFKTDSSQAITSEEQVNYYMQLIEQYQTTTFHLEMDIQTGQAVTKPGLEAEAKEGLAGVLAEQNIPQQNIEQIIQQTIIPNSNMTVNVIKRKDLFENEQYAALNPYVINTILEDRIKRVFSLGDTLIFKDIMEIDDYPLKPIMNRWNRNPFPMGDVEIVQEIQKYINKTKSLILAHASNSTNVKILVNRGSINREKFESEFKKAGTAILETDMELGRPEVLAPPPLPNELYKNLADAKSSIYEILGIYPMMQGDTSQMPKVYRNTIAADEFNQRRIQSKKDDIESALNSLARIIVQYIQRFYSEQKVFRLLGQNKQNAINVFDPEIGKKINDISIGKYDIIVVSGSMLPSNRWAKAEYYKDLLQLGLPLQKEIVMNLDLDNPEEILQRIDTIQQLQGQLKQAGDQIKKLEGDLQTAQRETIQDRKRVEVEKFKSGLVGLKHRAEAGSQLYSKRLDDLLALQEKDNKIAIKEMKYKNNNKKGRK